MILIDYCHNIATVLRQEPEGICQIECKANGDPTYMLLTTTSEVYDDPMLLWLY